MKRESDAQNPDKKGKQTNKYVKTEIMPDGGVHRVIDGSRIPVADLYRLGYGKGGMNS